MEICIVIINDHYGVGTHSLHLITTCHHFIFLPPTPAIRHTSFTKVGSSPPNPPKRRGLVGPLHMTTMVQPRARRLAITWGRSKLRSTGTTHELVHQKIQNKCIH